MLSETHQYFLSALLYRKLRKKDVNLYRTNKAFYCMTGYLQKNNLIKSEIIDEKGTKRFSLTTRGEMLALLLDSLTDFNSEKLKEILRRDQND